jgi:hypothetical protein
MAAPYCAARGILTMRMIKILSPRFVFVRDALGLYRLASPHFAKSLESLILPGIKSLDAHV